MAQKIKVISLNMETQSEIKILQVSGKDTVEIERATDSTYQLSPPYSNLVICYKLRYFNLGRLPTNAKSIVLKIVPNEQNDCYVVYKVINDTIQSDFNKPGTCDEVSELTIYDTFNPDIQHQIISTRKKKE